MPADQPRFVCSQESPGKYTFHGLVFVFHWKLILFSIIFLFLPLVSCELPSNGSSSKSQSVGTFELACVFQTKLN